MNQEGKLRTLGLTSKAGAKKAEGSPEARKTSNLPDSPLGESGRQPRTFSHDASLRITEWFLRLLARVLSGPLAYDRTGSFLAHWASNSGSLELLVWCVPLVHSLRFFTTFARTEIDLPETRVSACILFMTDLLHDFSPRNVHSLLGSVNTNCLKLSRQQNHLLMQLSEHKALTCREGQRPWALAHLLFGE